LAILAGGEGRRMGRPKGDLRVGTLPILQYLLEKLNWPGPTLLVTAPGRQNPPGIELFDRQAVDPMAQGPLRGILTCLENCQTDSVAITTVDMPGIGTEQLQWMLDRLAADEKRLGVMSWRTVDGRRQIEPFPMACRRDAAKTIAGRISEGNLSVRSLTEIPGFAAEIAPVDWPKELWTNLNTEEEYDAFIAASGEDS
jgi:molybdopterin-guanine dinucleotide biosynthesis protein A